MTPPLTLSERKARAWRRLTALWDRLAWLHAPGTFLFYKHGTRECRDECIRRAILRAEWRYQQLGRELARAQARQARRFAAGRKAA